MKKSQKAYEDALKKSMQDFNNQKAPRQTICEHLPNAFIQSIKDPIYNEAKKRLERSKYLKITREFRDKNDYSNEERKLGSNEKKNFLIDDTSEEELDIAYDFGSMTKFNQVLDNDLNHARKRRKIENTGEGGFVAVQREVSVPDNFMEALSKKVDDNKTLIELKNKSKVLNLSRRQMEIIREKTSLWGEIIELETDAIQKEKWRAESNKLYEDVIKCIMRQNQALKGSSTSSSADLSQQQQQLR